MKRLHLFEFGDLSWFPSSLHNYMTDYLQFIANKLDVYQGIVGIIKNGLTHSGGSRILDLASGGGGGMLRLAEKLQEDFPDLCIHLTDYAPNKDAFEEMIAASPIFSYEPNSVDARDVPSSLEGFRTIFLALHHFRPADARKVLQNAVDAGVPIGVFEAQERNAKNIIGMVLIPIFVWLTTPFIKPFKLGRIIFTYLIPILPIIILWDGLVSTLRTYSIQEMQTLVDEIPNGEQYDWEIGKVKSGPGEILYLLGHKK